MDLLSWRHPTKWHVIALGKDAPLLRAEALCSDTELHDVMSALMRADDMDAVSASPPLNTSGYGRQDDRYSGWFRSERAFVHTSEEHAARKLQNFLDDYDNIHCTNYLSIDDVSEILADADYLAEVEIIDHPAQLASLKRAHEKVSRAFLERAGAAWWDEKRER